MRIRLNVDTGAPEEGQCILKQHSQTVTSPAVPQNEDGLPIMHQWLTWKSNPRCGGQFASVANAESSASVPLKTMKAVVVQKHQARACWLLAPGRRQKQGWSPPPLGEGESLCCEGRMKLIECNAASLKALHNKPGTHCRAGKRHTRWGLCGRKSWPMAVCAFQPGLAPAYPFRPRMELV